MDTTVKRPLMIARGWIQAAAVVLISGFFIMGVLTYYTYNDEPPIPDVVKDAGGSVLFTRDDIMAGQQIFLRDGHNGIWFDFWTWRVPRARLHGGISARRREIER